MPPEAADVVYAVNTVHIARDLQATLARIRGALRPGGRAVFSECVRPFPEQPIYVEFVFNFLENFTGVVTDARTRPNHGFLTPANWRDALPGGRIRGPGDPPRRRGARAALRRVLRRRGQRAQAGVAAVSGSSQSRRGQRAEACVAAAAGTFRLGSSQNG